MAMRIVKPELAASPKVRPTKDRGYLSFIHRLPCVVTLRFGVEAAHISFANREFCHFGRGKGHKASDRWVLPLAKEQHDLQHSIGEKPYWESKGINPHALAVAIYGLWTELGDDAEQHCIERILNGRARR
jgi:hypothetical protein